MVHGRNIRLVETEKEPRSNLSTIFLEEGEEKPKREFKQAPKPKTDKPKQAKKNESEESKEKK